MIARIVPSFSYSRRAMMVAVSLGPIAGCNNLAACGHSAAHIESPVYEQATGLQPRPTRLLKERDQLLTTALEASYS